MTDVDFGRWLKQQLRSHGMKQADLARKMQTSTGSVSMWARGKRIPEPYSCDRIADALGMSNDAVLTAAGHRPPDIDDEADPRRQELVSLARLISDDRLDEALAVMRAFKRRSRRLPEPSLLPPGKTPVGQRGRAAREH